MDDRALSLFNEAAARLAAFVTAFPESADTHRALATLSPEAVALLDEVPRVFLNASKNLATGGVPPTHDALIKAVGIDRFCELGLRSWYPLEPPLMPHESVETINKLAVLDRRARGARLASHAAEHDDPDAAQEAARLLVESTIWRECNALPSLGNYEELASAPMDWCFPGLLMNKTVAMLSAGGGTGKTTLATGLALSLATGRALFPSLTPARQGRVIFASGEDGPEITSRRIREYARRFGLHGLPDALKDTFFLSGVGPVFHADQRGGMTLSPWAQDMRTQTKSVAPSLVVLDHARRLMGAQNGNSNEGAGEVMAWLSGLAQEEGCAVLVLAHASKNREVAGTAAAVRGASALVDEARLVLDLSRKDNGLRLKVTKSNYSEHGQEFSFRFVPGQDAACLEEITATDTATGSGLAAMMGTAIRWLEGAGRLPVGAVLNAKGAGADLLAVLRREHGNVSTTDTSKLFDLLEDRGLVEVREEKGADRHPRKFYKLADNVQIEGGYVDDDTPF